MTLLLPLLTGLLATALAGPAVAQKIYSCVDAKGRRLTADRPIMECLDREQKEIVGNGAVRMHGPSLSDRDLTALEAQSRAAEQQRLQAQEDKRRDRALLGRYPTPESHQRVRAAALAKVDDSIAVVDRRLAELARRQPQLDAEVRTAGADPVRGPRARRAAEDNAAEHAAEQRVLATQTEERKRLGVRFDEELARLKPLWSPVTAAAAEPASQPRK